MINHNRRQLNRQQTQAAREFGVGDEFDLAVATFTQNR